MELVEVELVRVVIHQKGDQQFIHLRERQGSRGFPIVIGFNEVEEINRKLCGVQPPRPLTHDLVGRILGALGHRLHRVVINELREATFYATLVLVPRDASHRRQQGSGRRLPAIGRNRAGGADRRADPGRARGVRRRRRRVVAG